MRTRQAAKAACTLLFIAGPLIGVTGLLLGSLLLLNMCLWAFVVGGFVAFGLAAQADRGRPG